MKLNRLEIKNFRGMEHAELEFGGKTVIIYGTNGTGKTSVLDAIDIIFSKVLATVAEDTLIKPRFIRDDDVMIGSDTTSITIELDVNGRNYSYYRKREEGTNTHSKSQLTEVSDAIRETYVGRVGEDDSEDIVEEGELDTRNVLYVNDKDMPVYISYGVERHIESKRKLFKKKLNLKTENNKLAAWDNEMFNSTIEYSLFFEWFRQRQEYENSIKVEDANFVDHTIDYTKRALLYVLGEEFTEVKIKFIEDNAELVFVKRGKELMFRQLSSGEKGAVVLVGDIARRMVLANPKSSNQLDGEGIVLIDEVDLHFHPQWQARILPELMKIFKNVQFIVTTHAPKVLGEVDDTVKIIRLWDEDGVVKAEEIPPLNGWDVNNILENFMETNSINEKTAEMIERIHDLVDDKRYDEAEVLVDKLAKMTDSENLEVVKGRVKIAKGRMGL